MLTLAAADTLAGVAQTASKVTCTVHGMELNAGVEVYKVLYQGQLASSAATLYTVPASTQAFIKSISAINTHNVAQTFQLFRGGLVAANAITPAISLPAGGMATYEDGEGWSVMDVSGQTLHAASGNPAGVVPVGGVINWSGTIAAIAALTGWALCNGIDNAPGPDLRDRFIVGASSDDAGVAKSNIRGTLEQSASATGHSHSAHATLSHAGLTIGDHTGLTHGITIANHPDLTHAALSHAAQTFSHADHTVASASHTHDSFTVAVADHASRADLSFPSHSHASALGSRPSLNFASGVDISVASITGASGTIASQAGVASFASGTNRSGLVNAASASFASHTHASALASRPAISFASGADVSVAGQSQASGANISMPALSHAAITVPSVSGTNAAQTMTHADHVLASMSHQDIGTHAGTAYGVHSVTAPAAHGTAGTVTHSFGQPDAHVVSAHDVVSIVPSFFALAFIQRMS